MLVGEYPHDVVYSVVMYMLYRNSFLNFGFFLGVYKECVAAALAFETAQNFLKGQKKTINEMFSRSTPKEEAIRVFALARKEANRQVVEQLGRVMLAD